MKQFIVTRPITESVLVEANTAEDAAEYARDNMEISWETDCNPVDFDDYYVDEA